MLTKENKLRRVIFRPYRKGMGPTFTLTTWDCERRDEYGKWILGYRLVMNEPALSERRIAWHKEATVMQKTVLFEGEDFHCAPSHCIDSDEAVEGIMAFLTLRPGDTDAEYFADYTPEQLEYCSHYAEALSAEVENRFGSE